jgi:hypothetical protein
VSYWHELEKEYAELKDVNARLVEENDIQRASIQQLSRQVAKYRELAAAIKHSVYVRDGCVNATQHYCEQYQDNCRGCPYDDDFAWQKVEEILAAIEGGE